MKRLIICTLILALSSSMILAANETAKAEENDNSATLIEDKTEDSAFQHFKYGMNSSLLSLLYTPLKVNVALAGAIIGGLAYPFSGFNADVSRKIWDKSMGGTYLITEDILKGEDELELFFKKNRN
ncbi:MAG: hypothetical protein ACUZ8O_03565 [Candidatus Anammoxibacter sp.]